MPATKPAKSSVQERYPNGIPAEMRAVLLCQKIVTLKAGYFEPKFVAECIDELERKAMLWAAGFDEPSPLERLAVHVLTHSAYIDKET